MGGYEAFGEFVGEAILPAGRDMLIRFNNGPDNVGCITPTYITGGGETLTDLEADLGALALELCEVC
jgi:hypothetical protein